MQLFSHGPRPVTGGLELLDDLPELAMRPGGVDDYRVGRLLLRPGSMLRRGLLELLATGGLAAVRRQLAPATAAASTSQELSKGAAPRQRRAQQAKRLPRPRRTLQQRVLPLPIDSAAKREREQSESNEISGPRGLCARGLGDSLPAAGIRGRGPCR